MAEWGLDDETEVVQPRPKQTNARMQAKAPMMYKPKNRSYIPERSSLMKSNEDDAIRKIEAMQAVTFGNG